MSIFDADAHWTEDESDLIVRAGLSRKRAIPRDGWDRSLGGRYPGMHPTASEREAFFQANGITRAAMHPTRCLSLGLVQEHRVAINLAEAYHEYALQSCAGQGPGETELIPMALAVPQAIEHTVANLPRYRKDGFKGVLLLPHGHTRLFGDDEFKEFFEACQELEMAVTLHGNSAGADGAQGFQRFAEVHCLTFPWALIRQFVSMTFSGVFHRHSALRVAFLEAGVGWMPYWLHRMDEEFALRAAELPIDVAPTVALRRAKVYVSCNGYEDAILQTNQLIGGGVVWQSDYPHWDHVGSKAADELSSSLPSAEARAMLWDHAVELYLGETSASDP